MASKNSTCCICGREYNGYGNNPYPLNKTPGSRCCDHCNEKVIAARYLANCEMRKRVSYGPVDYSKQAMIARDW